MSKRSDEQKVSSCVDVIKSNLPTVLLITCYDLAFVMVVSFLLKFAVGSIGVQADALNLDRDFLIENPNLIDPTIATIQWVYAKLVILLIASVLFYAGGAAFSNLAVWKKITAVADKAADRIVNKVPVSKNAAHRFSAKRFVIMNTITTVLGITILFGALFLFEPPMNMLLWVVVFAVYTWCSTGVCLALTRKDSRKVFRAYIRSWQVKKYFALASIIFIILGMLVGSLPYGSTLVIIALTIVASGYRVVIHNMIEV